MGGHLDSTFPYFWKAICFFVNLHGAPKHQVTMIFLRNRQKLFFKTVTLYYVLAGTLSAAFQPGARGSSPPHVATPMHLCSQTQEAINRETIPFITQQIIYNINKDLQLFLESQLMFLLLFLLCKFGSRRINIESWIFI